MAVMPMPTPRSLILLLLLASPIFILLSHPSSASVSHPDLILPKVVNDIEAHVVVLTAANFSSIFAVRRHVVVDFYAPWCYWSRKLAPEYAATASHLADKGLDVALAKVDATQERQLARAHGVEGYPTVLFFVDGMPKHYPYYGERTKDAMVVWVSQRLVPEVQNVSTIYEAEKIITGHSVAVLAFLDSLSGAHSDELAAASTLEDNSSLYRAINFYQTTSPDVAKLFHVDPKAKRPSLVMLKKQEEVKLTVYDGEFRASPIAEFVSANKIPVITYHHHTGSRPSDI
ncbi:protein disulfide isomerase-like 1-4 [Triticum aestivum]|nr:protein disulfide isomerase-like 1-4 [Triticum aestivum]